VPAALAVDPERVYWSAFAPNVCGPGLGCVLLSLSAPVEEPGSIQSVARGGGTPNTLVPSNANLGYGSIASDGTSLYWTVAPSPWSLSPDAGMGQGAVMKTPVGGGAASIVASGQADPTVVVADANGVYWGNTEGADDSNPGSVMGLTAGAMAPQTIASYQGGLASLAVDSTQVVWCANNDGTIMSIDRPTGTPTMLAGYFRCSWVAVNGDGVYFVEGGSVGETYEASPSAKAPTPIAPGGLLAANAHALYIATTPNAGGSPYQILRLDTDPGADATPTVIVDNQPEITAIAVDSTGLFWSTWDGSNGAVYSAPN
jgi:hypothetical protein